MHLQIRGGMACNPRSHLRLVYEGNPMAMVVEEAGGLASTGRERILDIQPTEVRPGSHTQGRMLCFACKLVTG